MLCQRRSRGKAQKEKDVLGTMGAQIIDVGTFDADEEEFLKRTITERKAKELEEKAARKKPEEVVRVE